MHQEIAYTVALRWEATRIDGDFKTDQWSIVSSGRVVLGGIEELDKDQKHKDKFCGTDSLD